VKRLSWNEIVKNRRVIVTHYGGPDALRVVEEECPEPTKMRGLTTFPAND
jgi:hypothetical protein